MVGNLLNPRVCWGTCNDSLLPFLPHPSSYLSQDFVALGPSSLGGSSARFSPLPLGRETLSVIPLFRAKVWGVGWTGDKRMEVGKK